MTIEQSPMRVAPVVDVRNVSMAYKFYKKPSDMLKEVVLGGVRHDTFWAIRDVSFSVGEGERVGIIGHNGAGKSTLLQAIAGNLTPTTGSVKVRGRISSLLSMVPAWNLEESGIQNIRFNLLVQGVPERAIPRLTEEIIDFTELGPFIFHPVKTYSTGMSARLSFAIATAIEPEILIIDEVLGTGDGYFAGKAYRRMQEFCARGKALLFVSHAISAVQQMCSRAIWMHNGSIRLQGEVDYVLKQYELDYRRSEDEAVRTKHISAAHSRLQAVAVDEVPEEGQIRFRIVAKDAIHFASTHYVREIRVHGLGQTPIEVPIDLVDEGQSATLDILGSEWGRIHERNDTETRTLNRATGRRSGGQFTVSIPASAEEGENDISIEVVSCADGQEQLDIEVLDMTTGRWRSLSAAPKRTVIDGWEHASFAGQVVLALPEHVRETVQQIVENARQDVEILGVHLEAAGQETVIVKEREPFDVCVKVLFRKSPDIADIGLKFSRADGVYVFWQSSGLSDGNLERPIGEKLVRFRFSENRLGAGEYYINAYAADGWRYPENYPYGQVFARVVNAAIFRVVPELPGVDFGVLNERTEVIVEAIEPPAN